MKISGYQNYRSSLLTGFRAEKIINKLRQIIPEVRSEMRDLLIFIFILKTTGTLTLVQPKLVKVTYARGRRTLDLIIIAFLRKCEFQ
jgi:hypothetical protein